TDPKDVIALKDTNSCPAWITANDQGTGYYHLLYQGDLNQKLLKNSSQLSVAERVDLLRNADALLQAGKLPAGDALSLARQFRNGPERDVITASIKIVNKVRRFVDPSMEPTYAKLIRDLFGEKARSLGWKSTAGEDDDTRLLRPEVLDIVGTLGQDPQLASEAKGLALKWLIDRSAVQADMVSAVLGVAAFHGDTGLFEQLLTAAKQSKDRRERERILTALSQFRDPAIANRALGLMLTDELDLRELLQTLNVLQVNPETRELPWKFVVANYDKLSPRLPNLLGVGGAAMLPESAISFCDEEHYKAAQSFFTPRMKDVNGGQKNLDVTLEAIQLCTARAAVQTPEINRFLEAYKN
ncbi:MAG: ERAP1-like C-terminal domain-containing protein, partial [Bryobacteraceae bacterium]|nr:ERAP1-like C-terminal domain-containing protein [Bryobacteraceae bacterium]